MRRTKSTLCLLFGVLVWLSSCGGDSAYLLKPQVWKNITVFIELRQNPQVADMKELLVVATRKDRRPAYDMIVSVSSSAQSEPVQTIQDGHSGIYRRAIRIKNADTDIIKVHIQSREKGSEGETILEFPVAQ